jgi:hypothetical protein
LRTTKFPILNCIDAIDAIDAIDTLDALTVDGKNFQTDDTRLLQSVAISGADR